MAKEKETKPAEHKAKDGAGEKKAAAKKHLHQIITTQAHDGSFSHEHIYKDKKEDHHSHPPVFAGTSSNLEDLHAHMDDHFGPQAGGGEPAAGPATAPAMAAAAGNQGEEEGEPAEG